MNVLGWAFVSCAALVGVAGLIVGSYPLLILAAVAAIVGIVIGRLP